MSLEEVCRFLSVSLETGRNWIRLGKIIPDKVAGRQSFFLYESVQRMQESMKSGENVALRSRRNKKFVSGNQLYRSYVSRESKNYGIIQTLLKRVQETSMKLSEQTIRILLAECAVQLIVKERAGNTDNEDSETGSFLLEYVKGKLFLDVFQPMIEDLLSGAFQEEITDLIRLYPEVFQVEYVYEEKEDILGLLYLSCRGMDNRKEKGAYYTPTAVVKKVIEAGIRKKGGAPKQTLESFAALEGQTLDFLAASEEQVLDPCCGTGNFLLQLPEQYKLEHIFGNDVDEISVTLTRINLALKHKPGRADILYRNITKTDYLLEYRGREFDWILGNPPWGAEFSLKEKKRLAALYRTAGSKNPESYDIFLEKALSMVKKQGRISFVLPEAVLNVRNHQRVRSIMVENTSIDYLEYLGNVFDKVYCPSLIVQFRRTDSPMSCVGMEVKDSRRAYRIERERFVSEKAFAFYTTDEEYEVLQKIMHVPCGVTLKNKSNFALGIVTGDNTRFLHKTPEQSFEPIIKGTNIEKYCIKSVDSYIQYEPDKFQQTALEKYYRAPEKLIYRFVSKQLVFAYDEKQHLTLNSCNIVVPDIAGLDIKYIMAVLNSSAAQFVFEKMFHSVKVLRSHIEQIPIPYVDKQKQDGIVTMVEEILAHKSLPEHARAAEKYRILLEKIDRSVAGLYGLTEEEFRLIQALL